MALSAVEKTTSVRVMEVPDNNQTHQTIFRVSVKHMDSEIFHHEAIPMTGVKGESNTLR